MTDKKDFEEWYYKEYPDRWKGPVTSEPLTKSFSRKAWDACEAAMLKRLPSVDELRKKIEEWNLPYSKSEWINRRNDEKMPITLLSYEVSDYIESTYDWLLSKLKGDL